MIVSALETGWIEGDGPYYPQPRVQLRPRSARVVPRPAVLRRDVAGLDRLGGRPAAPGSCRSRPGRCRDLMPVYDQLPRPVPRRARRRARRRSRSTSTCTATQDAGGRQGALAASHAHVLRLERPALRDGGRALRADRGLRAVRRDRGAAAPGRPRGGRGGGGVGARCSAPRTRSCAQVADIKDVLGDFELIVHPQLRRRCRTTRPPRAWSCSPRRSCPGRASCRADPAIRTRDPEEEAVAKLDVPAVAIAAEHNAPVEMRDGTVLRADIYRTAAAGSRPVLLIRNPYGEPMVRTAPGPPGHRRRLRGRACSTAAAPGPPTGSSSRSRTRRPTGPTPSSGAPGSRGATAASPCTGRPTSGWCSSRRRRPGPGGAAGPGAGGHPGGLPLGAGLPAGRVPARPGAGLAPLKSGQQLAYRAARGPGRRPRRCASCSALMADPAAGYAHLPLRDTPAVSRHPAELADLAGPRGTRRLLGRR